MGLELVALAWFASDFGGEVLSLTLTLDVPCTNALLDTGFVDEFHFGLLAWSLLLFFLFIYTVSEATEDVKDEFEMVRAMVHVSLVDDGLDPR